MRRTLAVLLLGLGLALGGCARETAMLQATVEPDPGRQALVPEPTETPPPAVTQASTPTPSAEPTAVATPARWAVTPPRAIYHPDQPEPTRTPRPSHRPEPTLYFSPTPTRTPTLTPLPKMPPWTETIRPTAAPQLREGGTLWLHADYSSRFAAIDPRQGSLRFVNGGAECYDLQPFGSNTVCVNGEGRYEMVDLITKSRLPLAMNDTDWLGWSVTGRYMLFYLGQNYGSYGNCDILDFDTETQVKSTLLAGYRDGRVGWHAFSDPTLSADGNHLAVVLGSSGGHNAVLDYIRGSSGSDEDSLTSYDQSVSGIGLAWSPRDNVLIYGALDDADDFFGVTHRIYFLDAATEKSRLLAQAPEGEVFGRIETSQIWSPDGERIAVPQGRNLCIIGIADGKVNCRPVVSDTGAQREIVAWSWSPQGKYIAFVEADERSPGDDFAIRNGILRVYEVATQTVTTLAQGTHVESVEWR